MITVIGSYATGMTMFTQRFPLSGETLIGHGFSAGYGGKGSNQAVGMARLGEQPYFVACVGDDSFGRDALSMYENEKVNASGVRVCAGLPTGVGFIIVDERGNNVITLDPGANSCLSKADVDAADDILAQSKFLVMQLEIPPQIMVYAAQLAHSKGIPVILNPAPYQALPKEVWANVNIVTPNETEARLIVNRKPDDTITTEALAEEILALGVKNVVITLGEKGAYVDSADVKGFFVSAFHINAVDTTGAGDTFTAALAVALSEGVGMADAVQFANASASLTCTVKGVVPALPYRVQVDELIQPQK